MNIEKLIIKNDTGSKKRLMAEVTIKGKSKPIIRRFGSPSGFTYYDGATDEKRDNYLKRHSKLNEDWKDITTAGALSRWVLWSERSSGEIEKLLKSKFKIPFVKVSINKNKAKQ